MTRHSTRTGALGRRINWLICYVANEEVMGCGVLHIANKRTDAHPDLPIRMSGGNRAIGGSVSREGHSPRRGVGNGCT